METLLTAAAASAFRKALLMSSISRSSKDGKTLVKFAFVSIPIVVRPHTEEEDYLRLVVLLFS